MNRSKELLEEAIKMAKEDRNLAMLEVLVPLRAELAKLHQAARDIVDFDIGEPPEPDGMCAAEGPKQMARYEKAWEQLVATVGPRDQARYYGDKP